MNAVFTCLYWYIYICCFINLSESNKHKYAHEGFLEVAHLLAEEPQRSQSKVLIDRWVCFCVCELACVQPTTA